MKETESFISIIIPCRNEEEYISKCLNSIITQDYLKDKLEVLVVDEREQWNKKQKNNVAACTKLSGGSGV